MSNSTEKVAVPEEKVIPKKEVDNLIQKNTKTNRTKTELVKRSSKNGEPNQVVYVKPRPDATEEENPLLTKIYYLFLKLNLMITN